MMRNTINGRMRTTSIMRGKVWEQVKTKETVTKKEKYMLFPSCPLRLLQSDRVQVLNHSNENEFTSMFIVLQIKLISI